MGVGAIPPKPWIFFIMPRAIKYNNGDVLGSHGAIFIRETQRQIQPSGQPKRRADFKCGLCGNTFNAFIGAVKDNTITSCGCAVLRFAQSRLIEYREGQLLGEHGVAFIKDVDTKFGKNRCGIFKCQCGKEFISSFCNIKNGNTTSCGCFGNSGYKRQDWINRCLHYPKRTPCLYVIEIKTDNENFVKIGLACNGLKYRFASHRDMPYNYSVLKIVYGEPSSLWDLELSLKKQLSEFRYSPLLPFNGHTECFNKEALPLIR